METRDAAVPNEPISTDGAAAGEPSRRTGPRKRVIFGVAGAIAVVLLLMWGLSWYLYARVHESTDDARVDASAVQINSKISERVGSVSVETNAAVKKGQLLVVLDDTDERARLAQARANFDLAVANQRTLGIQGQGGVSQAAANVAAAQTQVPLSQAGVEASAAQLHAAQAQVPAAQQAYVRAAADFNRTQSLVSTGDLPRQQLDAARAAEAAAAAALRGAEDSAGVASANLAASQQRVAASQAGIGAAQGGLLAAQGKLSQSSDPSQVEAARATLDLARQTLGYTKIYAPIDGYVGEKNVEIGQTVGPGMTLLTIIPNDVFITANYKETQVGVMKPNQKVDIRVDAYKGVTFHGRVVSINPASQNTYALIPTQNATGNFVKVTQRIPVKIAIDDARSDMPLRPGMSVETSVKVR